MRKYKVKSKTNSLSTDIYGDTKFHAIAKAQTLPIFPNHVYNDFVITEIKK